MILEGFNLNDPMSLVTPYFRGIFPASLSTWDAWVGNRNVVSVGVFILFAPHSQCRNSSSSAWRPFLMDLCWLHRAGHSMSPSLGFSIPCH